MNLPRCRVKLDRWGPGDLGGGNADSGKCEDKTLPEILRLKMAR